MKTEYAYDAGSQLTSILHKDENEAVVLGIAYEYDAAGNRTAITYTGLHPTLQGRHEYTYDALNRLISADHPAGSILPDESYAYDAVGNRTSSHLSTTYVYNTANRLLSDDQYTYTYDSVGNLFDRTRKSDLKKLSIRTEGSALFVMDRWTDESGKKRALFQDSLMRKVQEADQVGGTLTRKRSWLHDNEDWVVELEQKVVGNQNVIDVAKVVTHGPGIDEPIMISMRNDLVPTLMAGPGGFLTCASCMQDSYPLTDALGSVLALVDDQGALVQTYAYDSFGRVLSDAGGIPNDYGYTGREIDRSTGMMFYRNRWYDPAVGRFNSDEPSFFTDGEVNLQLWSSRHYAYARNSPLIAADPSGLWSYKPGVTPISPTEEGKKTIRALACLEACMGFPLVVTGAAEKGKDSPHKGSAHGNNQAADIGMGSNPKLRGRCLEDKFRQCAKKCGFKFGQHEGTGGNSTGEHYHIQTIPGKSGGAGFLQ